MSEPLPVNIDFQSISEQLKVRPEILKRLIKSFALSLNDKMKGLDEALGKNDAAQMRAILHEIKGTAGNLRLNTITGAENVMHEAVKVGEDPQKLGEYLRTLKQRVQELQDYLAKQES